MEIIKARKQNIESIAEIHIAAFHGFFLTSLGKGFLKLYYSCGLKSKESIFLCALDEGGGIAGFCFGTKLSNGFHKRLIINNLFSFALFGIKLFLSRPKAILRLMVNLEKKVSDKDDGNYAELLSIAVSPNTSQKGIGKALLKAFEEEVKTNNSKRIALTTDLYDNYAVVSFYQNAGYIRFSEFTAFPDRKMLKFIKDIS